MGAAEDSTKREAVSHLRAEGGEYFIPPNQGPLLVAPPVLLEFRLQLVPRQLARPSMAVVDLQVVAPQGELQVRPPVKAPGRSKLP